MSVLNKLRITEYEMRIVLQVLNHLPKFIYRLYIVTNNSDLFD